MGTSTDAVQREYLCATSIPTKVESGYKTSTQDPRSSCAPKVIIGKAFEQGFYWPTIVADAKNIMHSYKGCQFYA
jgi:hypothetical protein